jgi:hypothetical protein
MKLVKFLAWATTATAIGWAIGGSIALIALYRILDTLEQADLDDDVGGFDPQQALDRFHMRNAYAGGGNFDN